MKIFLTGASGFIGKRFRKLAIKNGCFVYAPSRKKRENEKSLKWLKGNFDYDWKKELSKSDIVVHLAAIGLRKASPQEIYNTNVNRSINLLTNAIKYNCKKWLIISTSEEYSFNKYSKKNKYKTKTPRTPRNDYGLSKVIFTDSSISLAKKFNCKARIMRIFPVYGPGEDKKRLYPSVMRAAQKGKNFFVENPNEKREFSHVDYVSKVLLDAMNFDKKKFKSHQIWHVTENKPEFVKVFVKKYWKDSKAKGRIILNKKSKVKFDHISDKKSVWKLTAV